MCPNKLKRSAPKPPLDVMCRPYKAYVLHHLEYCCTLLLGVGIGQVKKLEDTNNYIVYILRSSLC